MTDSESDRVLKQLLTDLIAQKGYRKIQALVLELNPIRQLPEEDRPFMKLDESFRDMICELEADGATEVSFSDRKREAYDLYMGYSAEELIDEFTDYTDPAEEEFQDYIVAVETLKGLT